MEMEPFLTLLFPVTTKNMDNVVLHIGLHGKSISCQKMSNVSLFIQLVNKMKSLQFDSSELKCLILFRSRRTQK